MKHEGRFEKRRDHKRRIDFRDTVQSFLIVCEGSKTEPNYFEGFRVPKDIKSLDIKGTGKNTQSLVKEAIDLKAKGDYDQVWCVFDVEDYPAQNIHDAIELAQQNNIQVAYSNQAFELWYLLHFHYYNTAIPRQQYSVQLSKLLHQPYDKCNPKIYLDLITRQPAALRNAKQLLQEYRQPDAARDNPSTTVHLLVEQLNRFTPESRV